MNTQPNTVIFHREGTLRIQLRGLTDLIIDPESGTVAIDYVSGVADDDGPDWHVRDLRAEGRYGDFHLLDFAVWCTDAECAASGKHAR